MTELLRYQISFTAWANERVRSAAAKLMPAELDHDFKTSENSILRTLVHIYRAERVWLERIEHQSAAFTVPGDDSHSALSVNWPRISERWMAWAQTMTDESAAADLTYQDLKGNSWTQPIWQVILHVVNHSTHHRGQAIGFIRALGHVPPNVDSISYARGVK